MTHIHKIRFHRAVAPHPFRLDDGRVISAQDDDDEDDLGDDDDGQDEDDDDDDGESELPPGWSD